MRGDIPEILDTHDFADPQELLLLWQAEHDVPVTQGWPLDTGSLQKMYIGLDASSTPSTFSIPNNDTVCDVQCENLPDGLSAPKCQRYNFELKS